MTHITRHSLILTVPAEVDRQRILNKFGSAAFESTMQAIADHLKTSCEYVKPGYSFQFTLHGGKYGSIQCSAVMGSNNIAIKSIRLL